MIISIDYMNIAPILIICLYTTRVINNINTKLQHHIILATSINIHLIVNTQNIIGFYNHNINIIEIITIKCFWLNSSQLFCSFGFGWGIQDHVIGMLAHRPGADLLMQCLPVFGNGSKLQGLITQNLGSLPRLRFSTISIVVSVGLYFGRCNAN